MADVFLSYSRSDTRTAKQFENAFREAGLEVWRDVRTPTGAQWWKNIKRELDLARCVVTLWSPSSIKSEYVLYETAVGRAKLAPVFVKGDVKTRRSRKPPPPYHNYQAADLTRWKGDPSHPAFRKLLSRVRTVSRKTVSAYPHVARLKKREFPKLGDFEKFRVDMQAPAVEGRTAQFAEIRYLHGSSERKWRRTPRQIARGGGRWPDPEPDSSGGNGRRRFHLVAPGGSGKTTFLLRLAQRAIREGWIPFYVDLKDVGSDGLESVHELVNRSGAALDQVIRANRDGRGLFLLDGLNESGDYEKVVDCIWRLAIEYGNLDIIVADRMNERRELYENGFELATLAPVSKSEVRKAIQPRKYENLSGPVRKSLHSPFFLRLFLEDGSARKLQRRTQTLERYIRRIFQVEEDVEKPFDPEKEKIRRSLADEALLAYDEVGAPRLNSARVQASLGSEQLDHLIDQGLLIKDRDAGERLQFMHQLVHDYLAAYSFLKKERDPTSGDLAALSMGRSSDEAVALAAELVADHRSSADLTRFVARVYDWDTKYALDCVLALEERPSDSKLDKDTRLAILAARSEKVYEPFEYTRKQLEPLSRLLCEALGFKGKFPDRHEDFQAGIKELAPRPTGEKDSRRWSDLYFANESAGTQLVVALLGKDSLAGWTASNVIRRIGPTEVELATLSAVFLAGQTSGQVQWRIVHALGGSDDDGAADLLFDAIWKVDLHEDVRYGAAWSYVGIALRQYSIDSAKAGRMLQRVSDRFEGWRKEYADVGEVSSKLSEADKRTFGAFRKCAILTADRRFDEWASAYAPILQMGIEYFSSDESEQRLWEQTQEQLE